MSSRTPAFAALDSGVGGGAQPEARVATSVVAAVNAATRCRTWRGLGLLGRPANSGNV
jgi:hypothetical protein